MKKTAESFMGNDGRTCGLFFDLADQPIEVTMVVSTLDIKRFSRTCATKINVLYIQTPIDLGMTASDRRLA